MEYQAPVGAGDPNDPYVDFNVGTGTAGSIPPAAAIEHTQREIVNFIDAMGIVPDEGDLTQLQQAITAAVAAVAGVYDFGAAFGFDALGAEQAAAVQQFGWFVAARPGTLTSCKAKALTAPTGQALIFDIRKNGVTVFTTLPEIAAGQLVDSAAHVIDPAQDDFVAGDVFTFHVTQIGSTFAGSGLMFTVQASAA